MLKQIKNRWKHQADPRDSWYVQKFFSKEWFETILFILGFLVLFAGGYLVASWLFGDYVADRLFDFLLFGIIIFMVAFAWGLEKGK